MLIAVHMFEAEALAHMGEISRALPQSTANTEITIRMGIPAVEQATRVPHSVVLELAGRLDEATEHATIAASYRHTWAPSVNDALAQAAHLLVRVGRPAEALAMCEDSLRLIDRGVGMHNGLLRVTLAEALDALGRRDEARAALGEARRLLDEHLAVLQPRWQATVLAQPWHVRLRELERAFA
jgi:hypothetical protein